VKQFKTKLVLSLSNMQIKVDELKEVIKDDFWDWIAHYLVVQRVSIELNFYSQFIDTQRKESKNENILRHNQLWLMLTKI